MTLHRTRDGLGDLFNPQIALECESESSLKIAEACLHNNTIPIAVHTDSILSDKQLPLEDTKTLGCWRCDAHGKAISLGWNQAVCQENHDHHAESSINFAWLYDLLANNPGQSEFTVEVPMPWLLFNSLKMHRLDKLGSIDFMSRTINLKTQTQKRGFPSMPTTGEGILKGNQIGLPVPVSVAKLIRATEDNTLILGG
jgi:hypothetical protein